MSPYETPFSGVVFKIQANMDPSHRDRIAFVPVTYPGGLMLIPGTAAIVHDLARNLELARIPLADGGCESIELAPDVPGIELLDSAAPEALLAVEGSLQLRQTFDARFVSDRLDSRNRSDRGRPTRELQLRVTQVREPSAEERRTCRLNGYTPSRVMRPAGQDRRSRYTALSASHTSVGSRSTEMSTAGAVPVFFHQCLVPMNSRATSPALCRMGTEHLLLYS